MRGAITLHADNGLSLQDSSGVQATTAELSTVPSPDGSWKLTGVLVGGYYTLVFSKKGCLTAGPSNVQDNDAADYWVGNESIPQLPDALVTES